MTDLLRSLSTDTEFVARHNGPNLADQQKMLERLAYLALQS
ncbi:hypothetical protein JCM19232_4264 [Vibrio ishigakensis]|uniref:Glycine dehydrogenase n=1 Tax=Vibrio ishigakensis TaxID=1481914 RepID=A0A0B8QLR3_9VIBR|nr:hypothetical protein JCM19231_5284 [Vibrio ishigakensis]GAM65299.1 hypothetical protein JCM19232_4264 [Vibrio ishigakensis]GAM76008.1 glycine dehydrogenase [Vibrio ishigakensis]